MKRIVFLLLFVLISINNFVHAQSNMDIVTSRDNMAINLNKFFTVKGIELRPGLKIKSLVKDLLSKGFKKSEFNDLTVKSGYYDLYGSFFNRDKCNIKIFPTSNNKTIVGLIGIIFPKHDSFKTLKEEYDFLKSELSKKYALDSCEEKFNQSEIEESSSDGLKLLALKNNEARFESTFILTEDKESILLGKVTLTITYLERFFKDYYCVMLGYTTSDHILEQITNIQDDL